MAYVDLAPTEVFSVPKKASLRSELKRMGLARVNETLAHEHIAAENQAHRPNYILFVFGWLARICWAIGLEPVLRSLAPQADLERRVIASVFGSVALLFVGIFLQTAEVSLLVTIPLMMPLATWIIMLFAVLLLATIDDHTTANIGPFFECVFFWKLRHLDDSEIHVPEAVRRAAAQITDTFPDVCLRILMIENDPFLVAIRGWGPWREMVLTEAWDTGNSRLDTL